MITKPNNHSKFKIIALAHINTTRLTAHVALVRSTRWFSTKNATGISVVEIVDVTDAIDKIKTEP